MASACTEREQDLVLYHYGELGGSERQQITAHLHGCAACARYLEELAVLLPQTVKYDEPGEQFWQDYSREMRHRMADLQEKPSWRQVAQAFLRSWTLPALATAGIVALALTITFGDKSFSPVEAPGDDEAFMEALPLAENLELIDNMEVLESIDSLEVMGDTV